MIVRKYGIELHRLKKEDIELVRRHRNSESIKKHMFYQQEITAEEQLKWFHSINNIYNYYFVIIKEGKKLGLIHGKNIDYNEKSAEGGIFIWDTGSLNTYVPVLASVIMIDLTFNILGLDKTFAEVKKSNVQSKHYNSQLGYILYNSDVSSEKEIYILTKEEHLKAATKIRNAVEQIGKDKEPLSWSDIDFTGESEKETEAFCENLPGPLRAKILDKVAKDMRA